MQENSRANISSPRYNMLSSCKRDKQPGEFLLTKFMAPRGKKLQIFSLFFDKFSLSGYRIRYETSSFGAVKPNLYAAFPKSNIGNSRKYELFLRNRKENRYLFCKISQKRGNIAVIWDKRRCCRHFEKQHQWQV